MNRISLLLLGILLCMPLCAQRDQQAKELLDKASATFRSAGGIQVKFDLTGYSKNGTRKGSEQGEIKLKGNKFVLDTNNATSWFDGQTQWSYLKASDEVNISNPTPEELENINPYSLISQYRQGYNYKYNGSKSINGRQGDELILTPTGKNKDISRITLFISKNGQPIHLKIEQKDQTWNEITITSYKTGEKYPDSLFKFNKRNYPDAETVDLR